MLKLESDLKDAEARIQYMEQELAKKMEQQHWQNEEEKKNEEEMEGYVRKIESLEEERSNLINNVNALHN